MKRSSTKHTHILAASFLVTLIAAVFLVLGPITKLGAADGLAATARSVDGSSIAYAVQGRDRGTDKPTLVFIHGWTCDRGFWKHQVKHFSKTHRVVSLDLAGHGSSGSTRKRYTMHEFGHDVAAVVEQVGADRVVLIGHSMGGPVAIEAATLLGDRVAGIVAVDIFFVSLGLPGSEEGIEEFLKPFQEDFRSRTEAFARSMFLPGADPDLVASIAGTMSSADKYMAISALRNTLEWMNGHVPSALKRYAPELRNINARIDRVRDEEAPIREDIVEIPDVGHFIAQVKPDVFNKALERILPQ